MDRRSWIIVGCSIVVIGACKPQVRGDIEPRDDDAVPDAAPSVDDRTADDSGEASEAPSVTSDVESAEADEAPASDHPFSLGGLVSPPEVTPTLLLVGGGWCPGAIPVVEQIAATEINAERAPREIKREYFTDTVLHTYGHPGQNTEVKNPEAMRDFFERTAKHLESHYPKSSFGGRVEQFTCVLADEDAGCERVVCMAPPTRAYTDGSNPEELWVVTDVAYGNVRPGD